MSLSDHTGPARMPRVVPEKWGGVLALLTLGAGVLVLGGCSGFKAPSVEHVGAEVVEQSEMATVYRLTIRASNPNRESMPLRELSYRLAFSNGELVEGERSPEATVPAFGTIDVSFPAVYPGGASPEGLSYTLGGELVYVSPGEFADVLFDAGVSRPKVSLSGQGTLPGG